MKTTIVRDLAMLGLMVLPTLAIAESGAIAFDNPVITRDWPDPAVWSDDKGGYCSVATRLRTLMRSPDLVHWTDTKTSPITPTARAELEKVSRNLWAPCVVKVGSVWNLYISLFVSDANCKIAVLTAAAPTGPFEYRGIVIDSKREQVLNAIDPYVLEVEGKVLMFFGSLADGVHVVELTADGLKIAPGAQPQHVAGIRRPPSKMKGAYEGSYVMKRGEWWYLFVSGGNYANHTYYLTVGRSAAVTGPYLDREGHPLTEGLAKPILASGAGERFYGPGHNGEVFAGADGRTYMFYHAHCEDNPRRERPTLLQELKWTQDGWPCFEGGKPAAQEVFRPVGVARAMEAKSPDGLNSIEVAQKDGVLGISVRRRGVVTLTAKFEGLEFAGSEEGPDPTRDAVVGVTTSKTEGVRQTPVYKRASISLKSNRTRIDFARGWAVELAARNDGVAYRFMTSGKGRRQILSAKTTFTYPSAACKVWPGYSRRNGWKGDQFQWGCQPANQQELVANVKTNRLMCLPMLSHDPKSGVWALLTEADLHDYPGMSLWRAPGTAADFTTAFAACPDKIVNTKRFIRVKSRKHYIADVAATRTFPWRVILMGDEAKQLSDSDAVAALSQGPDKGADFSWVKPGLVAWDWWNDWNLKGVSFKPGIDTRTYKYYIDFASRYGIPYVILDEGWSVKLDVTRVQKNIDLPELIRYGAERKVDIILWCAWAQLPGRQDEIFSKYAQMGVKGFKIDFFNRDDQVVMAFLEETARIAAKYRFHVDYHGICKPSGLEQRYPNILSYEGVHGLEELKWVKHRDMPRIDCQHFFLRNVAGPMDYTPGAMRNQTRESWKPNYHAPASQGTRCHQLALLTLFYSPLQMMADAPTNYEANEECARYMAETPTTWDESVTLGGIPGKFAAVARRKGDVWWVAAICDWQPRELELDLGFLSSSGEWVAETFADAPDANLHPEHYVRTPAVSVGRMLKVKMAPGGGFVARIRRPVRIAAVRGSAAEALDPLAVR